MKKFCIIFIFAHCSCSIDLWQSKKSSPTGNWTPVSRVTGGDTYHYTIEDWRGIVNSTWKQYLYSFHSLFGSQSWKGIAVNAKKIMEKLWQIRFNLKNQQVLKLTWKICGWSTQGYGKEDPLGSDRVKMLMENIVTCSKVFGLKSIKRGRPTWGSNPRPWD